MTQLGLDFDPLKAGAIGYSLPSWRNVEYDTLMYSEHPELCKIIKSTPKNRALPVLKKYFESFYLHNANEMNAGKERFEYQLQQSHYEIRAVCNDLFGASITFEQPIVVGISATPPQLTHASSRRIDMYYKTTNFIPSFLHELIHVHLASQLRLRGEFEKKMKEPDEFRSYIELETDRLLDGHGSDLARKARAGYTFTDEDRNCGSAERR